MRHLHPLFEKFLDEKMVSGNIPPQLLVDSAIACIGIKEDGPDNHGPMVEVLQCCVGLPQGQPWCVSFVQSCVSYVEAKKGILSPLPAYESVLELWYKGHNICSVSKPQPGDIILWQMGDTPHGHCGIIISLDVDHYRTIEGNTSELREIDRNGDGVYRKLRKMGGSVTFRELGFLRPFL